MYIGLGGVKAWSATVESIYYTNLTNGNPKVTFATSYILTKNPGVINVEVKEIKNTQKAIDKFSACNFPVGGSWN